MEPAKVAARREELDRQLCARGLAAQAVDPHLMTAVGVTVQRAVSNSKLIPSLSGRHTRSPQRLCIQ